MIRERLIDVFDNQMNDCFSRVHLEHYRRFVKTHPSCWTVT